MTIEDCIKAFHSQRKANKGQWVFFEGTVHGETVLIKSYGTTIQIAKFKGMTDSGPCDCSVKILTQWLFSFLSH